MKAIGLSVIAVSALALAAAASAEPVKLSKEQVLPLFEISAVALLRLR